MSMDPASLAFPPNSTSSPASLILSSDGDVSSDMHTCCGGPTMRVKSVVGDAVVFGAGYVIDILWVSESDGRTRARM